MLPETTIAPSTTMPTANARPASEITLMLRPRQMQRAERREQADGIVRGDHDRRARVAHEPPHAHQREQCADDEVLDQQVDGARDEQRGVERLLDAESALPKRAFAQLGDDLLHFLQRAQHVRAGRALDSSPMAGLPF